MYIGLGLTRIITASVRPPSTLAVGFCYSETRAWSFNSDYLGNRVSYELATN